MSKKVFALRKILTCTFLWIGLTSFALAEPMVYIYNGPESKLDHRYDYHWAILKEALERTKDKYGPFELKASVYMSESRQRRELMRKSGNISVMFLGTTPELERTLIPIRIPVDRDLSGYFVFLIRGENQKKFSQIKDLNELRAFSMGMASDWLDTSIYKANNFRIVTGNNYDGLFDMLLGERFDAFPRSVVEIIGEYEDRRISKPELNIESSLMLHYHWPMYFWFSNSKEGKYLAERAREGMMSMIDDGTYLKIFDQYFASPIERIGFKKRRLFELQNPTLPAETPLDDARLWYRPESRQ